MIPRPRFRMPLWAAMAAVLIAYALRSAVRGFDFTPDMPMDLIVLVVVLVVVALVGFVRVDDARRDSQADDAPTVDDPDPEP